MFEKLALYCNNYAELIPVSFVLGKKLHLETQGWENEGMLSLPPQHCSVGYWDGGAGVPLPSFF